MPLNEVIAIWSVIILMAIAGLWEMMRGTASSSELRDTKNDVFRLKLKADSIDTTAAKLMASVSDIDSKLGGIAAAVYDVSDKLNEPSEEVASDAEGRELTIEVLHQRLDNIERFIQSLSDKLDYVGIERRR